MSAGVSALEVSVYEVPTDEPESDGTLAWQSTTAVVVEVSSGQSTGIGYTYANRAVAELIVEKLKPIALGSDPMMPASTSSAMQAAIRNDGRPGVGAMAVSAVDIALWDLKAKQLDVCLADLLPRVRENVPIYPSGGFTSYSNERLQEQLESMVAGGAGRVKIKVGRHPANDQERLQVARKAVGESVALMVDANGAFGPKQALGWAEVYREYGVDYLEEPVSSADRTGLRLLRERGPAGMDIAAGEYEWDLRDFGELVDCVDIAQADVTRIGGVTNMLRADGICMAAQRPLSAHCAPAVSAHVCCALESLAHIEYFHDHVRLEDMLFSGTLEPKGGALEPDRTRPGLGLEIKKSDMRRYEA